MQNISTPVDFTETSKLAIQYACTIAKTANARIQLFHVIEPDRTKVEQDKPDVDAVRRKLIEFSRIEEICDTEYDVVVEIGSFPELIPKLLKEHNSDLVLIGTHGVKGIFQTMQGAEVLKLIQHLGVPSLILQNHSKKDFLSFGRILFPIASHRNFDVKMRQTGTIAGLFGSKVLVFVLFPEKGELDSLLEDNLTKTKKYFEGEKVDYEVVREPSKVYGIGYARQAMEYSEKNDIQLISIMAHASDENSYFGNVERTEFVLNKMGIPVLCCSD